jgi:hypothetical protein
MGLLACPTVSAAASASSAEQAARITQVEAGHKDPLDDAARPKAPDGLETPQRSTSHPLQQGGPGLSSISVYISILDTFLCIQKMFTYA